MTGPNAPKGAGCLFEDDRGGLWIGGVEEGREGLTYFDGSRFLSPVKNFPKVLVSGMAEDNDGGIWIASTDGLLRLFRNRLDRLVAGSAVFGIDKLAGNSFIAAIAYPGQDPYDRAHFVRVTHTQAGWRDETLPLAYFGGRMQVDRFGNILYPCLAGFCEVRTAEIAHWHPGLSIRVSHHPFPFHADTWAVLRDRFGCIWMRGNLDAAYQCPADANPHLLPSNVGSRGSPEIFELRDGSIVMPSMQTLAIGRPTKFRVITRPNGYPSAARSLVARNGDIWVSNSSGVFVLPMRLNAEFWNENNGLDGNTWSVLTSKTNTLAIAGNTVRLLDTVGQSWGTLAELDNPTHLLMGPENTILVSGLSVIVQMTLRGRILRKSDPVAASTLAATPDGNLWASGSQIFKVELNRHHLALSPVAGRPSGIPDSDLKVGQDGSLWGCNVVGLVHKDNTGWHVISKTDGLLENRCRSFAIDRSGDVWYSYQAIPAFSLIHNPTTKPVIRHYYGGGDVGLPANNFFASDSRGWLWRGAEDGLYVADQEQARQGRWLHLDRNDALPSADSNRSSFIENTDGSVWFGAGTTITHLFPPNDLVHPNYSPAVFVSGLSLNGGSIQMARNVDAVAHGSEIVANIGSLQFDRRSALRLRYRLLPEETDWKPERNLDIKLGKLGWGDHKLELQARLGDGPWSGTVDQSFKVLKPIWLTWPFLVGFAAVGGLAAAGGQRWRSERKRRDETELPGLEEWRLAVLSPDTQSLSGTLLDKRFEIGPVIARGGFATVFESRDQKAGGGTCAVKIFRHELLDKVWLEKRFQHEISALTQIEHPNVVRIHNHGWTPSGAPYLVMEFISGKTLREVLKERRLDHSEIARYLRQVSSALQEIHGHGVCHRDVKPENLMIRDEIIRGDGATGGDLVLIDFSIAIVQDPDETLHGLSRAAGTLYYMAPEQAIGYADESSDIYSLAKILIEMLTGQRLSVLLPDASIDLPARVRELLTRLQLGLSTSSIDLIATALEFDPSRRPKNAGKFGHDIAQDLELGSQ